MTRRRFLLDVTAAAAGLAAAALWATQPGRKEPCPIPPPEPVLRPAGAVPVAPLPSPSPYATPEGPVPGGVG